MVYFIQLFSYSDFLILYFIFMKPQMQTPNDNDKRHFRRVAIAFGIVFVIAVFLPLIVLFRFYGMSARQFAGAATDQNLYYRLAGQTSQSGPTCPKVSQASLALDTPECPTSLGTTVSEERTHWVLEKTAQTSLPLTDPNNEPIDFAVKVTEGPTDHILTAIGQIVITNNGGQTPTLSSIVVNLQDNQGKPVTVSTAVAVKDPACRDGQGVEGGQTCFGTFSSSPGATVQLTDSSGNDITALLGNVPIPPSTDCSGAVRINYRAEFNLDQAGLAPGKQARIEVLTTFAGAGARGKSPEATSCTVDANCSGAIDGDNPATCQVNESEQNNVRTVKQRSSFTVPPFVEVCSSVQKVDAGVNSLDPACVSASSNSLTMTMNKSFTGAMDTEQITGTASCVSNDACSTDIVNTATLTCVDGRNEFIQGSPASAAIQAVCSKEEDKEIAVGDFCTATQGCWGQPGPGGFCANTRDVQYTNLVSAFAQNFGLSSPGGVLIGDIFGGLNDAGGGFAARWTTGAAVRDYLPSGKTPGTLTVDLNNPLLTSSGVLDAQLLATTLNKARDDAGLFEKNRPERLADLVLQSCNSFTIAPALQGLTVKQLICVANKSTSGGAGCTGSSIPSCMLTVNQSDCGLGTPVQATLSELNQALDAVNNNFDNCTTNLGCLRLP